MYICGAVLHKSSTAVSMETTTILPDLNNSAIAFERKSDTELSRMEWLFRQMNRRWLVNLGSKLTLFALKLRLPIQGIIKSTIFPQFCGGTNLPECAKTAQAIGKYNVLTVLDYGAEGKQSEDDLDKTMQEFLNAIRFAAEQNTIPIISCKITGLTPFHILEKVSAGQSLSEGDQKLYQRALDRLDTVCAEAHRCRRSFFIDAEESWIQQAIDDMTDTMMERYNRDRVTVYNTFQLYRHDRLDFLKKSYDRAIAKGYILGAKMVRGAYMEKERDRAQEMGYPSPIQPNKEACDRDYDAAVRFCIEHYERIASCVASHNPNSTLLQVQLMNERNIPKDHPHLLFCQLYGMSDNITFNLAKAGYRVAKYVPYGPVREVIPYLIRRAEENSAAGGELSRELSVIIAERKRRKERK